MFGGRFKIRLHTNLYTMRLTVYVLRFSLTLAM